MFNTFVSITCCNKECHVDFVLSQGHYDKCKNDNNLYFYCPNGHRQHFRDSETDKLRRERDRLIQNRVCLEEILADKDRRLEEEKRRVAAARGQVTKIKNRVGNGVCPCCNRTFSNLTQHMHSKHPDFKKAGAA